MVAMRNRRKHAGIGCWSCSNPECLSWWKTEATEDRTPNQKSPQLPADPEHLVDTPHALTLDRYPPQLLINDIPDVVHRLRLELSLVPIVISPALHWRHL